MFLFINTPTVTDNGWTGGVYVFTKKSEEFLEEGGDAKYELTNSVLCLNVYQTHHCEFCNAHLHTTNLQSYSIYVKHTYIYKFWIISDDK